MNEWEKKNKCEFKRRILEKSEKKTENAEKLNTGKFWRKNENYKRMKEVKKYKSVKVSKRKDSSVERNRKCNIERSVRKQKCRTSSKLERNI